MQEAPLQWRQISFVVTASQKEAIEDLLLSEGAVSITEESGDGSEIFQVFSAQQAQWQQVKLTALFEDDVNLNHVNDVIAKNLLDEVLTVHQETIQDEDWHNRWLSQFKPIEINSHLWVCPSWLTPPEPNAINIMIDPGMAFGTGTHETTKGCLLALSMLDMNDKQVIDYGCGSGILSIAAKKLGAKNIKAIDIDAKALLVSRQNCEQNNVAEGVDLFLPEEFESMAKEKQWQADIVIANILSETLIELKAQISEKIKPGGSLILSGILEDQAEKIMVIYDEINEGRGIHWQQWATNNWVTLLATFKS